MAFIVPSILPRTGLSNATTAVSSRSTCAPTIPAGTQEIRAAKHVQLKGAKKSDRRRPKKHRPSDINRKPPPFNPEPLRAEGLPPVMTIIPQAEAETAAEAETVAEAETAAETETVAEAETVAEDAE